MSNEQSYRAPRRRGPRGPMGGGMMPGEKAKDFKGSFRNSGAVPVACAAERM